MNEESEKKQRKSRKIIIFPIIIISLSLLLGYYLAEQRNTKPYSISYHNGLCTVNINERLPKLLHVYIKLHPQESGNESYSVWGIGWITYYVSHDLTTIVESGVMENINFKEYSISLKECNFSTLYSPKFTIEFYVYGMGLEHLFSIPITKDFENIFIMFSTKR